TDSQDLSLSGDDLSLSGDPTATPIDLSGYTETVAGANDITVTDDGNGNYTVDYVDGDKSSTNELSDLSLDGSNVLTLSNPATGGNSVDLSGLLDDDDVSITNTVTGNRIATISEPGITSVDINETVTSLSQNTSTGVITYVDEDGGTPATANVVSSDANNELSVGADGGASFEMTNIDVDGDGTTEDTVDSAMADITKVTAKSARIFYPPSIAIDASTNVIGANKDLYQEYVNQYAPTAPPYTNTFVSSTGAPGAIPTYNRADLYYYITYYDDTIFDNVSIDANGVMTYDIIGQPADYNALINVVFVVK
ncbi:hypothetical protein, partial [Flagellimonas pelagia]